MFVQNSNLTELKPENFRELQVKFKENWPEHILAFTTLEIAIRRFENNNNDENLAKFYTLGDSWRENSTFIAILYYDFFDSIVVGTTDKTLTSLKTIIQQVDFSSERFFMCIREIYHPILLEVIKEKNLKIHFDDATDMVYIEKEKVMKLTSKIPENYDVKPLTVEWADKINSVWPHRKEDSKKFIARMIRTNSSSGIFHESGELASWCLHHDNGSLLALQTDVNHLRRGLGSIAAQLICKNFVETNDVDVHANIVTDNEKSLQLFKKLGFRIIDKTFWIQVENQ